LDRHSIEKESRRGKPRTQDPRIRPGRDARPEAARHRTTTLRAPYPLPAPRRVFSLHDDQGNDCYLFSTDADNNSFKVVVPKTFDVGAI